GSAPEPRLAERPDALRGHDREGAVLREGALRLRVRGATPRAGARRPRTPSRLRDLPALLRCVGAPRQAAVGRGAARRGGGWRALRAERGLAEARLFLAARDEASGNALGAAAEIVRAVRGSPRDRAAACEAVALAERHPEIVSRLSPALRIIRVEFGGPRRDP